MQFITDSNIWIDFQIMGGLDLPFRLPFRFTMCTDAVRDELLSPQGLNKQVVARGLLPTDPDEEEYFLALKIAQHHVRLARYDALALSIAMCRKWPLLSGDRALRIAAEQNRVQVHGTLWILDELDRMKRITWEERSTCYAQILKNNGRRIRLPQKEVERRAEGRSMDT